jgi:phage terminase large subunit
LFNVGDQLPVIPLDEVDGRADNVDPEQIADTCENVGVTFELTVTVIVEVVAHCPAVGVNV